MAADEDIDEPDRFDGTPHPRERAELFGHDEAERAFLAAFKSGQLHHAWLIGGPEGIGKGTLAYRAARFLLANPDPNAANLAAATRLVVPGAHSVARQVAALSHPDLAVVRRGLRRDGKGYSTEISVEAARRALDLFQRTASGGGYRVCIVDAADDLNASSANALLKMIEEPPARSIFLIVAHHPARLLATIRSRCRALTLRPLAPADIERVLRSLGSPWSETEPDMLARATALSHGSVHRALHVLDEDAMALVDRVRAFLHRLPEVDIAALVALADGLSGRGTESDFALALDVIIEWLGDYLRAHAGEGAGRLAPLVEVWEKSASAASEAEEFNLDRRPLVISMFGDLADAMRRSRAA